MRIIAGEWRGRKLRVGQGQSIRPATDRVRESVFNVLGPQAVQGANVLDLFAGSGSLGLEALSRGAARLTSVERARRSREVLSHNLDSLGASDRVDVIASDAFAWVRRVAGRLRFHLILIDPPYAVYRDATSLAQFSQLLVDLEAVLAPDGIVVFERGKECPEPTLPTWARVATSRRYGRNVVCFLSHRTGSEATAIHPPAEWP